MQRANDMISSDFSPFDPIGPLFLEERLQVIPTDFVLRGMFFQPLVEAAQRVQPGFVETYSALTNYPMSEFLLLAVQVAEIVYPEIPPREALRRLGRLHLRAFTQYAVGRVLLASAGGFIETALSLIPRTYELLVSGTTATIKGLNSFSAVISLRHCWGFPEYYQVGVFEGIFDAFQVEGEVLVKSHSFSDVDLALSWRRKKG
jgi:uncharacterized protein (TIGR02265 family)